MTHNLANGEDFVEIQYAGNFYFKKGTFPVSGPFTMNGNYITPTVISQVESAGANVVETKSDDSIYDAYNHQYERIVGGRPASRPRR